MTDESRHTENTTEGTSSTTESLFDDKPANEENRGSEQQQDGLPVPRWIFSLAGHIFFAILGLALGYYILSRLRPETFPLPW